ncbi:MAG TPA: indolepyruvate oxidoreductase subunit beta family protein [Casimicrobiaceae bacterium]
MSDPISILIGALGGQGGGVLAEWLVEAATNAGLVAQSTSIPGVAQRTGATTYYAEVFPEPRATLGGRAPVLGLYPVPGHVDLVIASELLEAGRILQAGHVSADRTLLIASTSRTLTTAEKMVLGDGRFSSERLLDTARRHSRELRAFDMDAAARDAGTVVSSVMLGAIAGSGVLPIDRAVYEDVVRAAGVGIEGSLRGFERGFAAVAEPAPAGVADGEAAGAQPAVTVSANARREADAFPAAARDIVALGYDRVVEFQDAQYGESYIERLRAVDKAERAHDPAARHDARVLRETARFLALWMAFDDIVRVASLKCSAARFARVHREIGAGTHDVVRIVDHFKPGVPEFAGMLPPRLARRLVAWDKRRQARGRDPLAWPLHLRTHSIHGFLLLRLLAALRGVRRIGARYQDEQRGMRRWLRAIESGCTQDAALGYEIALCGRLIKGYGATNERGKANLAHILEHLVEATEAQSSGARAAAIREAREAALADEAGSALDTELVRHGAPPRPVTPQPIRWVPRRARSARPARTH